MEYSGAAGKLIHEKNKSKESRDIVPFFNAYIYSLVRVYSTTKWNYLWTNIKFMCFIRVLLKNSCFYQI